MTAGKFLGATVFAVVVSTQAIAADLATQVEPVAPYIEPAFTWSGFYVGVNGGGAFSHDQKADTTGTDTFSLLAPDFVPNSLDLDGNGFTGGVQVGYNAQFNTIVVGLEADINYVGIDEEDSFSGAAIPGLAPDGLTTSASQDLRWLGTVRGRLGFTPTPPLLVYATGGLAYGDVKQDASVTVNGVPGVSWSGSNSEIAVGWTIGGGVEYAFTSNWTAKLEYLYYDLGSESNAALGNAAVRGIPALDGVDYENETDIAGSIVRVGLNYKF